MNDCWRGKQSNYYFSQLLNWSVGGKTMDDPRPSVLVRVGETADAADTSAARRVDVFESKRTSWKVETDARRGRSRRRDPAGFSGVGSRWGSPRSVSRADEILTEQLLLLLAATVVRGLYRGIVVAQHRVVHDARRSCSDHGVAGH